MDNGTPLAVCRTCCSGQGAQEQAPDVAQPDWARAGADHGARGRPRLGHVCTVLYCAVQCPGRHGWAGLGSGSQCKERAGGRLYHQPSASIRFDWSEALMRCCHSPRKTRKRAPWLHGHLYKCSLMLYFPCPGQQRGRGVPELRVVRVLGGMLGLLGDREVGQAPRQEIRMLR
jgi:hypothetical protein